MTDPLFLGLVFVLFGAAAGLLWATGELGDFANWVKGFGEEPNGKTCWVSGCGKPAVWIVGTTPFCSTHAEWAERRNRKENI